MKIAIPIFDQVTALDAIGPYEVLSRLPGAEVVFVSFEVGPVRTDTRMLALNADASLDDVPSPDIVVHPGTHLYEIDLATGAVTRSIVAMTPTPSGPSASAMILVLASSRSIDRN